MGAITGDVMLLTFPARGLRVDLWWFGFSLAYIELDFSLQLFMSYHLSSGFLKNTRMLHLRQDSERARQAG